MLHRQVGLPGAVLMGLGSILGTGIFVSIGIAAGITGPSVVVAVALAALLATFNGLSSAQLAASHPVSGGTYAYGYRYLNPSFGFTAGWMFLLAKSASAATAALGLAGYAFSLLGITNPDARIALATTAVVVLTVLVAGGIQRSNRINAVIVTSTLLSLIAFVTAGLPEVIAGGMTPFQPSLASTNGVEGLLHATALMFVAYTGYGRIATLGEEVKEPARTIPRAIITTLFVTMALYMAVTVTAVSILGADGLAAATRASAAPLEAAAKEATGPVFQVIVALGALTAMAGVLLNLLLGLSRILLAMARQGDMPRWFAHVGGDSSPRRAVWGVGAFIAGLTLLGSVKTTWTFSAFTVLVYYAITNLTALRLPKEVRRYPPVVPALGLASCLSLAFWVEPQVWAAGLLLIAMGLAWHWGVGKNRRKTAG
jgi:APA family basic amino acid/polyamine antiporter